MTGTISERAMLVKLSIAQWTARKYDKEISAKVATDYQTSSDVGRYNKVLIAEEAIKRIAQKATEARTYHYTNTLPWLDDGQRILPAANYMEYMQSMQRFRLDFETAVSEFVDSYSAYVDEARIRLNGMFKESDYPGLSELAGKYSYDIAVLPMPVSSDFRVDLGTAQTAAIREDIERRANQATEDAMKDLWNRLHETVSKMAEKLADEKGIFRDSLVGNAVELCSLLPRLNITGDSRLETMRQEVERKLCSASAQELRDNPTVRADVAKNASELLDAMAGYTG